MSSIAGFFHSNQNFQEHPRLYRPSINPFLAIHLPISAAKTADYMPLCWMVFYTILTN